MNFWLKICLYSVDMCGLLKVCQQKCEFSLILEQEMVILNKTQCFRVSPEFIQGTRFSKRLAWYYSYRMTPQNPLTFPRLDIVLCTIAHPEEAWAGESELQRQTPTKNIGAKQGHSPHFQGKVKGFVWLEGSM